MRIYIAAPWVQKDAAIDAAAKFEAAGHVITKRWWEHREVPGYLRNNDDNDELIQQAREDIQGVLSAKAFILLNLEKSEGKAVETGLAIAHFLPIILVGDKSNIFHYCSDVVQVDTIEDALKAVEIIDRHRRN